MSESLLLIYLLVSQHFNLPPGLLQAVCYVESKHDIAKINYSDRGSPSYGVCQIKMETAKTLGFTDSEKEIVDPTINVYYAGAYLSKQLNRYAPDITKAVASYNSGTCRLNKCGLPRNNQYVRKVMTAWREGL